MSFFTIDKKRILRTSILTISIVIGALIGVLLSWTFMTYVASPVFNLAVNELLNIDFYSNSMWVIYITYFLDYLIFVLIVIAVINITVKLTKKVFLNEEPTPLIRQSNL